MRGSQYNTPKAIFYLLPWDYMFVQLPHLLDLAGSGHAGVLGAAGFSSDPREFLESQALRR